jgi:hypothetical protein
MTLKTLKNCSISIYDPILPTPDGLKKDVKIALHVTPTKPKGYLDLLIA